MEYIDIIYHHDMVSMINKPTRVTNTTNTAIDHLFVNSKNSGKINRSIIKLDLIDHYPILIQLELFRNHRYTNYKEMYKIRIYNKNNSCRFRHVIQEEIQTISARL